MTIIDALQSVKNRELTLKCLAKQRADSALHWMIGSLLVVEDMNKLEGGGNYCAIDYLAYMKQIAELSIAYDWIVVNDYEYVFL